jgi:low temperature requirement protein LtrA
MEGSTEGASRRLSTALREGERVMPLELFFDLVFVLALTQCTTLMLDTHTWEGLAQGVFVLALLWWTWTGYAWLTSVLDPEEGAVRTALFGAMAALMVAALCVPQAWGDRALEFAVAYAVVRAGHIALFMLASRDDPGLRHSVMTLAASTAAGVTLLIAGALAGGTGQAVLWAAALLVDAGPPLVFGTEGWRLSPGHFAERHGLIVIIALGETVVALGVGAEVDLTLAVTTAAILGIALVFELWWTYFDVVSIANVTRLVRASPGREQNAMARDVYSYLHLLLIAGIELAAVGIHEVLAHPKDHLDDVFVFALLGGTAIYLLGHVAVRLRGARTLNRQRLGLAVVLFALVPVMGEVAALVPLAVIVALLAAMIAYETRLYGEDRTRFRHEFAVQGPAVDHAPWNDRSHR